MQGKNKKLATPEGYELVLNERESVEIKINIPKDVLEHLEKIAIEKKLSVESVLKFFIGQGLRSASDPKSISAAALKRLKARKSIEENTKIDLAA
jgi:hypothetical protein